MSSIFDKLYKHKTWIACSILFLSMQDSAQLKEMAEQAAIEYLKDIACYECGELWKNCKCNTPRPWPIERQEIVRP